MSTASIVRLVCFFAAGIVILVGTAACIDEQQSGNPVPEDSGTSISEQKRSTSPAPVTTPAVPVADPCVLFSQQELSQLGYAGRGDKETISGTVTCGWSKPEGSLEASASPRGVNELNLSSATKVQPVTIGQHSGMRVEQLNGAPGDCSYSLAVTARSSVSVGVFMAGKTAQACALAEQAAKLVEPKLPRG